MRGEVFLRFWTAKEAVLKAEGLGLGGDPASVEAVALVGSESAVIHGTARSWAVRLVSGDDASRVATEDDRTAGLAATTKRERMIIAVADAEGAPLVWRAWER